MRSPGIGRIKWICKPVAHVLALLPFCVLVIGFISDSLGTNPVEALTHETGEWGLRILLITLAVTPLAKLTHSGWMIHFRRLIGLYCFFYVLVHFLVYLIFDLSLDFGFLLEDILDRPYITVGFFGFLILLLLALTSPISIRRKMGRLWDRLHKFVYLAGVLGVIHFLWITKADDTEPMIYGTVFLLLMLFRVKNFSKRMRRSDRLGHAGPSH